MAVTNRAVDTEEQSAQRSDPATAGLSERTSKLVLDHMKETIEGLDTIDIPAIADKAVLWALQDKKMLNRLMKEMIRPVFYQLGQRLVARSRKHLTVVGTVAMTDEAIDDAVNKIETKFKVSGWSRWYEHIGDRHVLILKADSNDLTAAAKERLRRGIPEDHLGLLWLDLKKRLEPGQVVGDVWSEEEIEAASRRIRSELEERNDGYFR